MIKINNTFNTMLEFVLKSSLSDTNTIDRLKLELEPILIFD